MSLLYLTSSDVIVALDLFRCHCCTWPLLMSLLYLTSSDVLLSMHSMYLVVLLLLFSFFSLLSSAFFAIFLLMTMLSFWNLFYVELWILNVDSQSAMSCCRCGWQCWKGSLTPVFTKQVPVADPGVGTRLLKAHCHESMLSMSITMAMSMNTTSMMNILSNLFSMNFCQTTCCWWLCIDLLVLDEFLSNYLLNWLFLMNWLLNSFRWRRRREIALAGDELVVDIWCVIAQAFCSQKSFREITLNYAKLR